MKVRCFEDYELSLNVLKQLYVDRVVLSEKSQDVARVLKKHPKLVVALNHGSMVGAMAGLMGMCDVYLKHAGGQRRPFGITWRNFYKLPGSRQLFAYLTQVNEGVNFSTAMKLLGDENFTDCCIMPEGELCNFGNGLDVQPFLSPRFIELAIRTNVPVLVLAHVGSEQWSYPMQIPDSLLGVGRLLPGNMQRALERSRTLCVPKLLRRKLPNLYMSAALYQPRITEWDLAEDEDERMQQLWQEANKVRALMQKMINHLQAEFDLEG